MGRNNRRKNKRNVDNTEGAEKLYRRRGTGSTSGALADSGDDPGSYTKPSSRSSRKKGSGKLRGKGQDDATSKTEVEEPPESSTKNNGDTMPPSATLDAQARFSGGSLEQETKSSVHNLAMVDRQKHQQRQVQQGTPGDEKDEEAREIERDPAAVVTAKESEGTGDGRFDDSDSTSGHPAVSSTSPAICTSPAIATTPSTGGGGAVVPTLPLGSNAVNGDRDEKEGRVRATVVELDRKPYSLGWAGGRKGRLLMKSVEDVLSDWLCTQETKVSKKPGTLQPSYESVKAMWQRLFSSGRRNVWYTRTSFVVLVAEAYRVGCSHTNLRCG